METQTSNPLPHPQITISPSDPASPSRAFPFTSLSHNTHSPATPPHDTGASPSALARHQLTRLLSPDLPTRDALYLFCNFSSYMRSPQEGAEGIKDNTDFHDTIRLLDYARTIGSNPHANVHVLHMKYRFQTPDQGLPTTRQGKLSALHYKDDRGRRNVTVPQPFSTLHDPVIKVDYQDNGVFNPLPSQAVFQHISQFCQPPPRIIVVSYVGSKVTENHLSAIAAWAYTSAPPIYVFSPLETRLREQRPLNVALHRAIPISMYAWPVGTSSTPSPKNTAIPGPYRARSQDGTMRSPTAKKPTDWTSPSGRREGTDSRALPSPAGLASEYSPRSYPPDPVATLSVLSDVYRAEPDAVGDRIPLWTLAPGAGILHGSTSVSLGVKLYDFSAVNLVKSIKEGDKGSQPQNQVIDAKVLGIRTSPMDLKDGQGRVPKVSLPPLDAVIRRSTAATPEPISRPGSAASSRKINGIKAGETVTSGMTEIINGNSLTSHPTVHLTPPRQDPTRLSPPDHKPPTSLPLSQQSWPRTKSWPTTREKVPGWRRGRREVMEDELEEMGAGVEGGQGEDSKKEDSLTVKMGHLEVDEASPQNGLMGVEDVVLATLAGRYGGQKDI